MILISCSEYRTADLVLRNGKVATVDRNFSIKEAIAVRDDKIVFAFDDGGTARYKYLPLDGTSVTWVHTTTAP